MESHVDNRWLDLGLITEGSSKNVYDEFGGERRGGKATVWLVQRLSQQPPLQTMNIKNRQRSFFNAYEDLGSKDTGILCAAFCLERAVATWA